MSPKLLPPAREAFSFKELNLKDKFGPLFADAEVSTILLPVPCRLPHQSAILGGPYETCIFIGKNSDVAERYSTYEAAVKGHAKWLKRCKEAMRKRTFVIDGMRTTQLLSDGKDE